MTLSPQWLDELRSRTTLSSLIAQSVKLTRAGREYKACCPFHNEKSPSFTVNDEKGFYHCFGCSAHGDAIGWMTQQRGLSFIDAVKELADAAGMDVPAPDPRAAKRAEAAQSLRDVTEAAAHWFADRLGDSDGSAARDYLKKRGISNEIQRRFVLGFAPDSRGRLKAALNQFPEAMLVESGMLIDVEDKETYDRFRGRLMIPIRDPRGRVIAFGGRILGAGEPKYLNSPDTPLFDKGRTLYNLDRASPASRKTERIIVVEGYMDVIALSQAGIDEVVAPLGTALTEQQIGMIWRMVPVPILCFDGDSAGQKAAMRAAMRVLPLLRPGFSLAFVALPEGQDPDDIVTAGGARALEALLDKAEPLVDHLWNHERAAAPLDTPEQRAGLKQRLGEIVSNIAHADVAAHYRENFRARYDALFFGSSRNEAAGASRFVPGQRRKWQPDPRLLPPHGTTRTIGGSGLEGQLAEAVLAGLLRHPHKIAEHAEDLASLHLADAASHALLETMIDAALDDQSLDRATLLTILAQGSAFHRAKALLRADAMHFSFTRDAPQASDGDDADQAPDPRAMRDLDEAIAAMIAWPEIDAALRAATERASRVLDEESYAAQQHLRAMKAELTRRLGDLMQSDADG